MQPLLLINAKTYGPHTLVLAKRIAQAILAVQQAREQSQKRSLTIALAVPAANIHVTASMVPTFSEHVDPDGLGAHTGAVIAQDVLDNGAVGSLINHSEDQMGDEDIAGAVARCREVGLLSVVCAKDAARAGLLARLAPDFVAMEPPELIGGDLSVSSAKPGMISETLKAVKSSNPSVNVLVGAGVKSSLDVRRSVELGAVGVLVASGVTNASDLVAAISELASGFD